MSLCCTNRDSCSNLNVGNSLLFLNPKIVRQQNWKQTDQVFDQAKHHFTRKLAPSPGTVILDPTTLSLHDAKINARQKRNACRQSISARMHYFCYQLSPCFASQKSSGQKQKNVPFCLQSDFLNRDQMLPPVSFGMMLVSGQYIWVKNSTIIII